MPTTLNSVEPHALFLSPIRPSNSSKKLERILILKTNFRLTLFT